MKFCKIPGIMALFAVLLMVGLAMSVGIGKKYDGKTVISETGECINILAVAVPSFQAPDAKVSHSYQIAFAFAGIPVTVESDGGRCGSILAVTAALRKPSTPLNHSDTYDESARQPNSTRYHGRLSKWPRC